MLKDEECPFQLMFSNFALLLHFCIQVTPLPLVLQGGTNPQLKITLRQAYRDVSLGENPCAVFQGCFSGQRPYSGTWLWVGMDGGSQISPPLSNLVLFIMRTFVICSVSQLSYSSGAGISGFVFF